MDLNFNKKSIFITAIILLFFVVAVGIYYFFFTKKTFEQNKAEIIKLMTEGDNYSQTANKIEKLLNEKEFENSDQEAHFKILLAASYINNSDNPKIREGINILKNLAVDSNYSNGWRAVALDRLSVYGNDIGFKLSKKYIFNDGPFKPLIKENKLGIAIRRLYEWSDDLFPMVNPNYQIAHWYLVQLVEDRENKNLSQDKYKEYLSLAKERIKKGETNFKRSPLWLYDWERLVLIYQLHGKVLGKLFLLKEYNNKKEIEESFKKAIEVYKEKFNIASLPIPASKISAPSLKRLLPSTVFYYAAFLAETDGEFRKKDIKIILESIYDTELMKPKNFSFYGFLKNEKNSAHDKHYHKREILLLANLDERFKDLLKQLGWSDEQLNIKIISLGE